MKLECNAKRQWRGFYRLYRSARRADQSGLDGYVQAMWDLTAGDLTRFDWYLLCHYGTTELQVTTINFSVNQNLPKHIRKLVVQMVRNRRLAS